MDYDASGLEKAAEQAEESDFPGRHTGCAIKCEDKDGDPAWATGSNLITVCEASDLDKKYGVFNGEEKPYSWAPHAEQDALFEAAAGGLNTRGATAYLTGSPCLPCAIALVRAGIYLVVISKDDPFKPKEWNIQEGLDYLETNSVNVLREA